MKRQETSATSGPNPQPRRGGFKADGSWDFGGTWQTPLGEFVRKLIMGRRFRWIGYPPYKASPADMARMIDESTFSGSFGNYEQWRKFEKRSDWPFAYASTSTAQSVILAGWGGIKGYWEMDQNLESVCAELGIERVSEWPEAVTTGRYMPDKKSLEIWNSSVSRYQPHAMSEGF